MTDLILLVNGKDYSGFTTASVSRSITRGAHSFELTAAPGDGSFPGISQLNEGDDCQIFIGDERVFVGAIDEISGTYDAENDYLSVYGSSAVSDLIDCSTAGKQFAKGATLLKVCKDVCKPFGINVVVHPSAKEAANEAFTANQVTLDAGEIIWEMLVELARLRALILTSNSDGDLLITRAGSDFAETSLQRGVNIKAAKGTRNHRKLFSIYEVFGQQPAYVSSDENATSQPLGSEKGDAVRYRPYVIPAENPSDKAACERLAQHVRRLHFGQAHSVNYTVMGWQQKDGGRLWQPNELISVTDDRNKLKNTERLITDATIRFDENGRTTQLNVMPKEAFDVLLKPAKNAGFVL